MIATLAIALTGLLLGAEPPATAPATPADDEELLRNLELIEQLELLERFELLVPEGGEAKQAPPSRAESRLTGAGAPATASPR